MLDDVCEWYAGDFVPRLKPNAKRVIISTRFHELDLIGRLMERDPALGFNWRHVKLPMIAGDDDPLGRQPGERLWPEWFTESQVMEARIRPVQMERAVPAGAEPRKRRIFQGGMVEALHQGRRRVRRCASTAAATMPSRQTAATIRCMSSSGIDPDGQHVPARHLAQRASSDEWVESFCDLVKQWKPMGWAAEIGQIKSGVGPFLHRRQREREAYVFLETFPTRGDKSVRAQSIRGRMALEGPTRADQQALGMPTCAPSC